MIGRLIGICGRFWGASSGEIYFHKESNENGEKSK